MMSRLVLSILLLLATTSMALGARDDLKPGSSAPGLEIEEWIQGGPVSITPGPAYVVVFWSTEDRNSASYLRFLDELNEIAIGEGIVILAISDEDPDVIKRFLGSRFRGKPSFAVAADRRGRTKSDWVDASNTKKSPVAFIVGREGMLMHIAQPSDDDFMKILIRVANGRYHPELEQKAKPRLEEAQRQRNVRSWRMANKLYDEVLALDRRVFADVALDKFEMALVDMGEKEAAYEQARGLIESYADDPLLLSELAKKIAADPKIRNEDRDLDLALAAARAAMNVVREEDRCDALATLAMVHYHRGELDRAVQTQSQAWMLAIPKMKPIYRRDLDIYQQARERAAMMQQSP